VNYGGGQNLERYAAVELRIRSQIHFAHAAFAKARNDAVMSDALARI
jgi:hypothetical protein